MWPFESKAAVEQREAAQAAQRAAVRAKNDANFRKGGLSVAVTGAAAVLAALTCRRSVVARRFRPTMFQANVHPPPFNPMKDAARAVCDATVLAGSLFGLGVASAFWAYGVGTLPELGQVLSTRYQQRRSTDRALADDPESEEVSSYLAGFFKK